MADVFQKRLSSTCLLCESRVWGIIASRTGIRILRMRMVRVSMVLRTWSCILAQRPFLIAASLCSPARRWHCQINIIRILISIAVIITKLNLRDYLPMNHLALFLQLRCYREAFFYALRNVQLSPNDRQAAFTDYRWCGYDGTQIGHRF